MASKLFRILTAIGLLAALDGKLGPTPVPLPAREQLVRMFCGGPNGPAARHDYELEIGPVLIPPDE